MEVREIELGLLRVSNLNVRKILTSEEDETGIYDLANDIRSNGLINPITVRKNVVPGEKEEYEIIAGQRRFLACKILNRPTIPCSIVSVTEQKAEELSLVENVQRNPMTNSDKIKTYNKLYNVYNKDIDKVLGAVNISKATLNKYIKLGSLPTDVIELLDKTGDDKLTIDVAVELTKVPGNVDKLELIENLQTLSTAQKMSTIKEFVHSKCVDVGDVKNIKDKIVLESNNMRMAPAYPYVIDENNRMVKIPQNLFADVVALIKSREGGRLEYFGE
jgi:ParB/RepB/Spo0J family partition protein